MSGGDDGPTDERTIVEENDTPVGKKFAGCVVDRKLGQGGMGAVYLGRRESDGEPVVLKFLAPEQATNPAWRARFVREASLMKKVSHPNIVRVFSVEGEGPQPYMVMEYVNGQGLDVMLKKGPLEPLEAARIARDTAKGLSEAHKQGIIHRDIKPANVLLTLKGEVKILDFGLAKEVLNDDGLSMPGQILGTPHYMAPEQWGDHKVDARCDIYSLGASLYQLVTKQHPFPGEGAREISRKVAQGSFARPRALVATIPEDLELAILQMMALDRRFRYSTAEQCVKALDDVIAGNPVEVPRLLERKGGKRWPLVPGTVFTLGRETTCEIPVLDRTVSRQHARLERTVTGYILRDLNSTGGTFVGGMRVKDVVLKDGDEVRLGAVAFEFRDPGILRTGTQTRRLGLKTTRLETIPIPFVDALVDSADRRAVVPLIEELAPDARAARVTRAREKLRSLLGGEIAETVANKLEGRVNRQHGNVPSFLFSITHENLGDDVEGWLSWWDGAHDDFPAQVVPNLPYPRARVKIVKGDEPRAIDLNEDFVFTVGRDEKSKVVLNNQAVSRLHATILRFHQRLAIRDEGSRFGTVLNGSPVKIAFLGHGDRIVLGKCELEFECESPALVPAEGEPTPIDPDAWLVLEQLQHPSTAQALVRFLDQDSRAGWIEAAAARLFEDPKRAEPFVAKVKTRFAERTKAARELLPKWLGPCAAPNNPAAWLALFRQKQEDLPTQVMPAGWFPPREGDPKSSPFVDANKSDPFLGTRSDPAIGVKSDPTIGVKSDPQVQGMKTDPQMKTPEIPG